MEERFDVDVLGKEKPTHVQTCKKSFPSPFVVDCENQRGSMRDSVKEVVESMAKVKEDGILDQDLVAENVRFLLNQKALKMNFKPLRPRLKIGPYLLILFCGLKDWHFWQKWPFSDQKKWHFEWPNQNSKTTFIVQTFPKYGPYDFYLVNLSLLGAILTIFQFCGFSGLFWPVFPL